MQRIADLTSFETELLIDIAEGRYTNYFLLTAGQKRSANRLQRRGLILTGSYDHRLPLALTDDGKRQIQRFLLAR